MTEEQAVDCAATPTHQDRILELRARRARPTQRGAPASRLLLGGLSASAGVLMVTAMAASAHDASPPDVAPVASVPDAPGVTTPAPPRKVIRIIIRRQPTPARRSALPSVAAPAVPPAAAVAPAPAAAPAPPPPPPAATTRASG